MSSKFQIVRPTPEEDAEITAAALSDPDSQPLTDEEIASMRLARDVLPREFLEPTTMPPRRFLTAEIELDVAQYFMNEAGDDWQKRIDDVLREAIASRQAAE